MPKNPFENQLDERYQAMVAADRPGQAQIDLLNQQLIQVREVLGKCEVAIRLIQSDGWKLLLEDVIIPQTSPHKMLATEGEKRAEACGEVRGLLKLKQRVEQLVKSYPMIKAKAEEIEKQLEMILQKSGGN